MTRLSTKNSGVDNQSDNDKEEMLAITTKYCLKNFVNQRQLSRQVENVHLQEVFRHSSALYLRIYGLLSQELNNGKRTTSYVDLPDISKPQLSRGNVSILDQIVGLDAYALDLLRMVIMRVTDKAIRFHLSSKIASLQILHDRMKELQ